MPTYDEVVGTALPSYDEVTKTPSYEEVTKLPSYEDVTAPSPTRETEKAVAETGFLSRVNQLAKTPSPVALQPIERAITSPLPGAKEAIHLGYQYASPLGWIEDIAPDSSAGKWAHDIRTQLEQVGTGFTSPANIGLIATGAGTGKAIQGLIGLGFTAQQAKTTLDTYREWNAATDPEQKHQLGIKLGVDTGLTALLGGGTLAGHLAPERPVARPDEAPATSIPTEQQNASTEVAKAQEGASGVPPQGTVRLYHGSIKGIGQAGRDFTTSLQYAEDYAAKAQGEGEGQVWYVDVPEGALKTHDEHGQPMTRVVVPDEIADKAQPLASTGGEGPAGDISAAKPESVPAEGEKPLVEGAPPETNGNVAVTSDEPHVSTIANRFTQERAAKGEIGEVAPGQGLSTADLVQRGLKMSPEKVTEAVSRVVQGGDIPVDDAAAIRGEEARLSQKSNQLSRAAQDNPNSVEAQLAADNAFKDLTDFHNGPVAQLKENWANQGRAMQGEIPVDLSTFNGLREQWLRDTGEAPPTKVEPTLRRTAENVSKAVTEENGARSRLAQEVEKQTTRRKFPTADEVRNNIRERMGLEPCR